MLTGEKLYNLRKREGWSQGELADKLNISRQSVSKWELNESLPDAENIVKISNLFNVSTDYLLKANEKLIQISNEKQKKKYYTLQGILTTLAGIATIGIINVLANAHRAKYNGTYPFPFKSFVANYGLDWLVYLASATIVIGLSLLIRDLYIYKSKKYIKLKGIPLKLFVFFTILIMIILIFCLFLYLETNFFN